MYRVLKIVVFLFSAISPFLAQGQDVAFNSPGSVEFEEPDGWMTSNLQALEILKVYGNRKVAGESGYALRLETIISGSDTIEGAVGNSIESLLPEDQGTPFFEIPTAIKGHYRYWLPKNDTAILVVIFMKEGNAISKDIFKIKGDGRQDAFTAFTFPLSVDASPDKVIIAASSSNLYSMSGIENGSFIELDNLAFEGVETSIPNGNFELWSVKSYNQYNTQFVKSQK